MTYTHVDHSLLYNVHQHCTAFKMSIMIHVYDFMYSRPFIREIAGL